MTLSVTPLKLKFASIVIILMIVQLGLGLSLQAQIKKDSLERVLWNSTGQDTNRVILHERLAYHYRFVSPDTALYHATQAYELSNKLKYTYGKVYSLNHLGAYYKNRGQYNRAMSYYKAAQEVDSGKINPRIQKGVALAINNIGMVCLDKEEYALAEHYFFKALNIDEALGYDRGIARETGNLGKLKMLQGKSDSALYYLNKSLVYEKAAGHTIALLETMVDIGKVYFSNGDFVAAKDILNSAAVINNQCYVSANVWIDHLLGRIYHQQRDFNKSLKHELRAMESAGFLKDKMLCLEIARDLAGLYKDLGKYKEAYACLDSVAQMSKNLEKEKFDLVKADLAAGFEIERKKEEIEKLHTNREKMIYYNSRLISMRNGLILSLCFCMVLGGIIYKAYRDKRNVNKVLMHKFSEIRTKNADIECKNREIEEINSSLIETNLTLNKREFQLKEAQRIAGLGSWEFDVILRKFAFTESLAYLFFPGGTGQGDLNLRSYLKMINPEDWPMVKASLKKAFIGGDAADIDFSITTPDRQQLFFTARAVPVFDKNGNMKMISGTVLDTSSHKRAEITLMEAKVNAELANQSKSVFLANMSHEIRTPLNGILGFTNLLLKECAVPQQKEYLNYIRKSGDNLLVLLNDILDFNKIEHGKLEIESTHFQIRQMVDEAVLPYMVQAREKGIDIGVTCSPEIPATIIGDPHRTRQLLINYLSNAMKFTQTGKIIMDISLSDISVPDGNDLTLKFTVTDTGIGVPKEKQHDIFNVFTQADSSTTRKYGGSGLGLAINHQLAKLMGGESGMQSPGSYGTEKFPGSDFWFTIKVRRGQYAPVKKAAEGLQNSASFAEKVNILVAEDNMINQLLIRKVLESMNCSVTMVENGLLAIKALETSVFDAILMDIQMPVMDGHQATVLIRQSGNTTIPIIGVSANVFKDDIERSMAAGMDAHLGKPFTANELFSILHEKLNSAAELS